MKENFIHVCFVIDESGSMYGSEADVLGGFKKVIDEQKANVSGTCAVSLYKFEGNVTEVYRGKDINEVEELNYCPGASTALFDGIGTAIDNIGSWLSSIDESERPEKNLIVIMTDGGENSSRKYSATQVKDMIKHQEEKYNWSFVYMGSDLTDASDANTLGFTTRCFSSKSDYIQNYDIINSAISGYRGASGDAGTKGNFLNSIMTTMCCEATVNYAKEKNLSVSDLLDNKE